MTVKREQCTRVFCAIGMYQGIRLSPKHSLHIKDVCNCFAHIFMCIRP